MDVELDVGGVRLYVFTIHTYSTNILVRIFDTPHAAGIAIKARRYRYSPNLTGGEARVGACVEPVIQ